MQSWSKYQTINLNIQLSTTPYDITSIKDALTTPDLTTIRVYIIDIRPQEKYFKNGIERTSTFVLVGDETGTSFLACTDLKSDTIQIQKTYEISKIRKKIFNNLPILTTTIDTSICLSTSVKT